MNVRTSIPSFLLLFLLSATAGAGATSESGASDGNWPSFRGPRASGVADGHLLPTIWSVPEGKNVKWRTEIPGLGHSSPVVWGDRIFLTTAVTGKKKPQLRIGLYGDITPVYDDTIHRFDVLSIDKRSGEILWQRTALQGVPKIRRHTKASHANSSAVTDGSHLVVFFGSEGLYSYDLDGNLKWKEDFGVLNSAFFRAPGAQWGFGSSPIIHDGKVIVQCDVTGDSFLAAFDLKDGRELWRTPRDEVPTWSTPTILEHGGKTQIVANGFKHIGGYEFLTGEEIWKLSGGGDIPVPTPVVAHDLIYVTNGHGDGRPISTPSAPPPAARSPCAAARPATSTSPGASPGVVPTCRVLWSTATIFICAATTASSRATTRSPARGSTASGSPAATPASPPRLSLATARSTSPARWATSWWSKPAPSIRCWRPTGSTRSQWRRRRSPKGFSISAPPNT